MRCRPRLQVPAIERPRRGSGGRWRGSYYAALLSFGLSGYLAVRLPPFFAAGQSRAHFSYSVMLLDGHLHGSPSDQPFTDRYPIIERWLRAARPDAAAPAGDVRGHSSPAHLRRGRASRVDHRARRVRRPADPRLPPRQRRVDGGGRGARRPSRGGAPRQRGIAVSAALLTAVTHPASRWPARPRTTVRHLALTTGACSSVPDAAPRGDRWTAGGGVSPRRCRARHTGVGRGRRRRPGGMRRDLGVAAPTGGGTEPGAERGQLATAARAAGRGAGREHDGARRQRVVLLARTSACTARQQRTRSCSRASAGVDQGTVIECPAQHRL